MKWRVLSWTLVQVPLPPFHAGYAVAVVESAEGERHAAHIERHHVALLENGVEGEVARRTVSGRRVWAFIPLENTQTDVGAPVAIVTGSSRGIGAAIVRALADEGYRVVVNSHRTREAGQDVAAAIRDRGGTACYISADVTDVAEVEALVDEVMATHGRIDVLVNNAGITADRRLANMTHDQWDTVIATNLTGVFNCTKAVAEHMRTSGGGRVVNISSIVGERGGIGQANYAASKGGVIALTKALAREYASDGVLVNAVAPGYIDTHILDTIPESIMQGILETIPVGRLGTAEEVAALVRYLVSDEASYVVGQVFDINGGL